MIVLGIESSCDETAAALVEDGTTILSSIVASQIEIHHPYGGVVPELASRKHLEAIVPIVDEALSASGITRKQIDAVAVTQGPGLIGSLLVGFTFAKALAFALGIPWVGVNHLKGHINSLFLSSDPPPPFPFVALLASGGHTAVYHVLSHTECKIMGQTRDDAVGEAYDKVAKMLGLGYPGGEVLDRLAATGDPLKIKFPRSFLDKSAFDFSFSGIKTSVNRYINKNRHKLDQDIPDIAAGFQEAVVEVLCFKLLQAAKKTKSSHAALVGGVSANKRLRAKLKADAAKKGITINLPLLELCGDNAAMIAAAGYHYFKKGINSSYDEDVFSRLRKNIHIY